MDLLDFFLLCTLRMLCLLPSVCLCFGTLRLFLSKLGSLGRKILGKFTRGLWSCLGCDLGLF
ncbi:hypothetical protein OZ13_02210 [Xanthomonas cannabis pv. cannabis]|nr:hypothetical protein OZ13_02210 [Xanthomonas cannabis pv. cannabis]